MEGINHKAQGNTFWIIIAAVIALVVLVVLIYIFTSKGGDASEGFFECSSKGGKCLDLGSKSKDECGEVCEEKEMSYSGVFSCPEEKCCCFGEES